jgi:phosphoglycerate dehydrogenase-like enzyme
VINTARGTVVDASDLVAAVRSGRLGGAAVDVYDPEPPDPRDLLLNTPGIICTPHTAAMTAQALRRMAVDVSIAVRDELHRIAAPAINVPRGEPPRVIP